MEPIDYDSSKNYSLTSTRKTGIKWGAIMGIAGVAFSLILFLTDNVSLDNSWSRWQTWVNYALMISVAVMCLKEFRDQENDGFLSIFQGLKLGVWVGIISGLVTGIYMYFYMSVLDTEFKQKILDNALEQAEKSGQNVEQAEEGMKMMDWMFSPTSMAVMVIIGSVFMLAIVGLLVSLFMRKDAPMRKF